MVSANEFFKNEGFTDEKAAAIDGAAFKEQLRTKLHSQYNQNIQRGFSFREKVEQFFMSKPMVFATAGGSLALMFFLIILLISPLADISDLSNPKSTHLTASLTYTEGMVEIKTANADWETIYSEQILAPGDQVRAADNSRAIVNLSDGSELRINEDSNLELVAAEEKSITFKNNSGNIYSRVAEAGNQVNVIVGERDVTSNGTAFLTTNNQDEQGVTVMHNSVIVDTETLTDQLIVPEGKRYLFRFSEDPSLENEIIELERMTLINDDFILWNRDRDETSHYDSDLGILADISAPNITIVSPSNGVETNSKQVVIEGVTEIGAYVRINSTNVATNNGVFKYTATLKLGANSFQISARDEAGNTTVAQLSVKHTQETSTTGPAVLNLQAQQVENGIFLSWSTEGLSTANGFYLITADPEQTNYKDPSLEKEIISNGNQRSYTWQVKDGNNHAYAVCQVRPNGSCGVISNIVVETAPSEVTGVPRKSSDDFTEDPWWFKYIDDYHGGDETPGPEPEEYY